MSSNKKVTELNNIDTLDNSDLIPVVDVSEQETKKITKQNLLKEVNERIDDLPAGHEQNTDTALDLGGENEVTAEEIRTHIDDQDNPHNVTQEQVGLGEVDNTSDADKPISTATQGALDNKSDIGHTHTPDEVGLGNVDNTSDIDKPISNDTQDALDIKANLVDGKVPASELPSFVDDVVEVANYSSLPITGETGKIYVTIDTSLVYRWTGSVYVEISPTVIADLQEVTDNGATTTHSITAKNFIAQPVLGTELAPPMTGVNGVNWNIGTGWTTPMTGNIIHSSDGTQSATATTQTITIGGIYYFELVPNITTGTFTMGCGGTLRTISANITYSGYFRATTTGKLFFTPQNTSRFSITSITLKRVNSDGDVSANRFIKYGGLSTDFLKANGTIDQNTYVKTVMTEDLNANYKKIINSSDYNLSNTSNNNIGAGIRTAIMPTGDHGLTIRDQVTGYSFSIFPRRTDGSAPVDGDIFKLSSVTGGFNPTAQMDYWELDPVTGALRPTNSSTGEPPFKYSLETGYGIDVLHSTEQARGNNTLLTEGETGISELSLEQITAGNTNEELFVDGTTYERIKIPDDFVYIMEFDVLLVQTDGKINRWKVNGCVENLAGTVAPCGNQFVENGTTSNYWYTDGAGGTDIASAVQNDDSSLYLQLDTVSANDEISVKIYQATPTTGANIFASVKIIKIKKGAVPFIYQSTYYGDAFSDTNANGTYNDMFSPYNGKPAFQNSNGYVLRYDSTGVQWEIVDTMPTVVYTFPTTAPDYDLEGIYQDYMSTPNGNISQTPPSIASHYGVLFFTDSNASGFYTATGNTVNGQPEYANTNGYLLYYDTTQWVITDSMHSYKYVSLSFVGQYTEYWTATPEGYISDVSAVVYTGASFTNTVANGGYWAQGNTYLGQPVYVNASEARLRYDGAVWKIYDNFYAEIYYETIGSPTGTYNDTSTTNPDGNIS